MGPVSDVVVSSFGSTILVEIGANAGFALMVKGANDLVFKKPIDKLVPVHSSRLETTSVKVLGITLKYKHTMEDAALGFYRSAIHEYVNFLSNDLRGIKVDEDDVQGSIVVRVGEGLFGSREGVVLALLICKCEAACHSKIYEARYRVLSWLVLSRCVILSIAHIGVWIPRISQQGIIALERLYFTNPHRSSHFACLLPHPHLNFYPPRLRKRIADCLCPT